MSKEIIFLSDKKDTNNRTKFALNEELWETLFHLVAFLAESGKSVKFVKEKKC